MSEKKVYETECPVCGRKFNGLTENAAEYYRTVHMLSKHRDLQLAFKTEPVNKVGDKHVN